MTETLWHPPRADDLIHAVSDLAHPQPHFFTFPPSRLTDQQAGPMLLAQSQLAAASSLPHKKSSYPSNLDPSRMPQMRNIASLGMRFQNTAIHGAAQLPSRPNHNLAPPTRTHYEPEKRTTLADNRSNVPALEMQSYYTVDESKESFRPNTHGYGAAGVNGTGSDIPFAYSVNGLPSTPSLSHGSDGSTGRPSPRSTYSPTYESTQTKTRAEVTEQYVPPVLYSINGIPFAHEPGFFYAQNPYPILQTVNSRLTDDHEGSPAELHMPQGSEDLFPAPVTSFPWFGPAHVSEEEQVEYASSHGRQNYPMVNDQNHGMGMESCEEWEIGEQEEATDMLPPYQFMHSAQVPEYEHAGTGFAFSVNAKENGEQSGRVRANAPSHDNAATNNRAIVLTQSSQRRKEDEILIDGKRKGLTYKQIRKAMGTTVAESTLRGRYRAITKERMQRVRRPVWTDNDIRLLTKCVHEELAHVEHHSYRQLSNNQKLAKISWKKIADYIAENGGSYHFGNSTCKKKWCDIATQR
ncbi:hypothetical protein EJ04DRAFT_219763 [Polyplosphaeria fusca]|uniref:Myb-like domain-containing protein n=1 Tax=Polyplosphaeria fusca TaxID=682080 RepID=A0A9P4R1I4_9PLEO|nr:hypothetical protein EJ04DRAFT_219763 [Polyplosphaeria fusca]